MPKFQPGKSGNPRGRPKGSRNKTTRAIEALLDGEAEAITRKVIEKAKEGDITAIKLCLDRLAPPVKDKPVLFKLPKMEKANDATAASAAIVGAVARGDFTPIEAGELMKIIEGYARMLMASDIEARLERLEQRFSEGSS